MEEKETRKFNPAAEYTLKVPSGEIQLVKVRFPKDEEWAERARHTKAIKRELGRGKSITESNGKEANAALFDRIRVEGGEQFDEAEKSWVIGRLERSEVMACEACAGGYRIELFVPGGIVTVHTLKMPKLKDTFEYSSAAIRPMDGRRETEYRMSLEPGAQLYDRLLISVEGYDGPVPIIHKDAVVGELVRAINEAIEGEA